MRYFDNTFADFNSESRTLYKFDDDFWKNIMLQQIRNILDNVGSGPDAASGALYTGTPGIAYALWYIVHNDRKQLIESSLKRQLLEQVLNINF